MYYPETLSANFSLMKKKIKKSLEASYIDPVTYIHIFFLVGCGLAFYLPCEAGQ